jgi:SpoVK/Ycf46/Vps4 family AAA+-type ATPase
MKMVQTEYNYLHHNSIYEKYNNSIVYNGETPLNNNLNDYIIEHKTIDIEINSLDDLIKMINDNPQCENVSYNIDMTHINKIKPLLIELNNMIGMHSLKNHVLDQILYFVQGLHKNKNNSGDFMHTVIYGPPGTGKTEVAKLLGKIYSKLGILKKEIFKKATRSDMVAGYLGQTAIKTRELIHSCLGGVLFIDEAYSLGNEEKRDIFSKECIDTLCELLSDNKDDLMVIIAGYEKELNECFFNCNQGLESRFIWKFKIDDYSGDELMHIFIKKINDNGWSLDTNHIHKINKEWFEKNIKYFKFFGRDMEILFTKTKIAHSRRVFCKPESYKTKITIDDLNKGFEMFISHENKERNSNIERDKLNSIYL